VLSIRIMRRAPDRSEAGRAATPLKKPMNFDDHDFEPQPRQHDAPKEMDLFSTIIFAGIIVAVLVALAASC
jgi:hypothetical protein